MDKQILISLSRQCSSIPVSFGQEILSKENLTILEHPPYSPDLTPADFYLFPVLKLALKGRCLCNTRDNVINATEELKKRAQNDFQECFQQHYSGWQKGKVA